MGDFILKITESASFFGTYEWKVFATKVYIDSKSYRKTKIDDFIFEDAFVERAGRKPDEKVWAYLDSNELYKLVETAYHNIQIPLIGVTFPMGLDGTIYTVEFDVMMFGGVKLCWWSSYPEEWEALVQWYKQITEFLNDALDNKANT
jgi:hypothetical protein